MKRFFLFLMLSCATMVASAHNGWSKNDTFYEDGVLYKVVTSSTNINIVTIAGFAETTSEFVYHQKVMHQGFVWDLQLPIVSIFKNNTHLRKINMINLYTTDDSYVGESYFEGCIALDTIYIGSAKELKKRAFYGCTNLKFVGNFLGNSTPTGIITVGEEAFYNCRSLTKMPGSTQSIGKRAYAGCTGLKRLDFTAWLLENRCAIGEKAFYGLQLDTVYIANDYSIVIEEGAKPFDECEIGVVDLNHQVTVAPAHMFEGASGKNITLNCQRSIVALGAGFMKDCYGASLTLTAYFPNSLYTDAFTEPLEHIYVSCDNYAQAKATLYDPTTYWQWEDYLPQGHDVLELYDNPYTDFKTRMDAAIDPSYAELRYTTYDGGTPTLDFFGCTGVYSVGVSSKDENWVFLKWSDGVTIPERTFNMTGGIPADLPYPVFYNRLTDVAIIHVALELEEEETEIPFPKMPQAKRIYREVPEITVYDADHNELTADVNYYSDECYINVIRGKRDKIYIALSPTDDYSFQSWEIEDYQQIDASEAPEELKQQQKAAIASNYAENATTHEVELMLNFRNMDYMGESMIVPAFATVLKAKYDLVPYYRAQISVQDEQLAMGTINGLEYPEIDTLVRQGQTVTVTAQAFDSYEFDHWSNGVTTPTQVITMTQDTTVYAIFGEAHYQIKAIPNGPEGHVTGGGTYLAGAQVTLTAIPDEGYRFQQWTDGNTDNPRTITVTQNKTYIACFEPDTEPLPTEYHISVFSSDPTMGEVTGDGNYEQNTIVTLKALPFTGYMFLQWEDGETNNPRFVTVTEDADYTAVFGIVEGTPAYTITVTSADETMGWVTGGGSGLVEGTTTRIEAICNYGYNFVQWNDGETTNPRWVTVIGNATYTAYFRDIGTDVENVQGGNVSYTKVLRDGVLFILMDGKTYNAQGQLVQHEQ
jgi:hypothetical protein